MTLTKSKLSRSKIYKTSLVVSFNLGNVSSASFIYRNARLSTNRSEPNILTFFRRKLVGGGGRVCITIAPHFP
jgi:hypothetical protein